MPRPANTGSRIRERRIALGRKQVAVAEAAGISPSYLNLIEHDRRAIGGRLLLRLAAALDAEPAALSGEGDSTLAQAVAAAGAAQGLDPQADADAFARTNPEWARMVAAQAETIAAQARTIDALSDRLTHDPSLAEAMHELLSTVSVVRSTAAILAQTPEIDANWLRRFHANLDQDSRRLAQGAEAVVALFDRQAARGDRPLLAVEGAARFLDATGHRFEALERDGAATIPMLTAEIADPSVQTLVAATLRADAADAERLPRHLVEAANGPDDLLGAARGDMALVLRRLGLVDPGRGLVICDAAGAVLRRKPVAGFPLPLVGAGCPLWTIYTALAQPGRPLSERLETPDGAIWRAHSVALPETPATFDAPPVLRATMLLTRADRTGTGPAGNRVAVGPGCRTCPRAECPARREPSILSFDT
ncbi:putative transcriptional regulator [Jannaschia seosinensis]|uniref:Putative transcriptional regulator n=1 Tax=Jannaschia seosinensis TaxID=313367 RepID=A0A0M7B869_9RHOB|nr:short-chain fatty acyl-CoA regulator family protein [Jannaschia seosinensis]CUH37284.1 putative transcriptional regulator [Jannaschia seosinensis]